MASDSGAQQRYVGPYTVERELGRGSYGVVYLARRGPEAPLCALKVHLLPEDAEGVARFRLESGLSVRLHHPGIVGAVESGFHGRHPWVAMEYVAGETLRERLRRGPIAPEELRELGLALAEALAYAHDQGVVHRDLKPENIMIAEDDQRPRILDFGLARDDRSVNSLTRTGDIIGSPFYMAPEQLVDSKHVDPRVDLYALGVIMYECLAGRRPFNGATVPEVFQAVQRAQPPSLRALAPNAPSALVAVSERAMARRPEDRFASAQELIEALDTAPEAPEERSVPGWKLALLVTVPASVLVVTLTVVLLSRSAPPAAPLASSPQPTPTSSTPSQNKAATVARLQARLRGLDPLHMSLSELATETPSDLPELSAARDDLARGLLQRSRKRASSFAPLAELKQILEQAERFATSRALIAQIQLARATYAFRRGRFEEATQLARRIDASGRTKLQARYVAAFGQLWQDRFQTSLPALERIWRDDPKGVVGQNAGAVFNSHTGKNDVGERLARAALALDPRYVDAYCSLAFCLNDLSHKHPKRKAKLLEASLRASAEAIRRCPDHPRPYMARAFALGNSGQGREALKAYSEVVRLTAPLPMARVLRFRAQRRLQSGDTQGALADLELALKRDPNDAQALTWRGVLRAGAGDAQSAERDWLQAFKVDRRNMSRALRGLPPRMRQRVLDVIRKGPR